MKYELTGNIPFADIEPTTFFKYGDHIYLKLPNTSYKSDVKEADKVNAIDIDIDEFSWLNPKTIVKKARTTIIFDV